MKNNAWYALVILALALPAVAAAQDEDSPCRYHDRDHDRCNRGLREVSGRRHHRREGFFLSAGLGVGSESFDANDGLGWSDGKAGAVVDLRVGGAVSQSLLLGVEGNIWAASYHSTYYDPGYDRSLGSLMFIAQVYPAARSDFWLRGGLGWARDNLDLYGSGPGSTTHENGTAWAIGLGYDFPVGRTVSLTPSLDLVGQHYDTHDERVVSIGLAVTVH